MSGDDSKQLEVALKAQYNRDNRDDVTDKVIDEIKSSIIFQYSWEDLLQSAPVALTCMGSCFIATASNTSRSLILSPPEKGFKFLERSSLDGNLVDNINRGRTSFLVAEANMGFVKDASKKIYNKVADVMDSLAAKTQLIPQLNAIKRGAQDCYEKAKKIDEAFEDWLNHAMELHAACVQTQSTTEERLYATQLNMAVAQSRFVDASDAVKFAKETHDKFGKQVQLASDAYKKASDEFPSGWDILGQQVVGALAETVTTALSQVVSAVAFKVNPVAAAKSGMDMFSDLIHGGKNKSADGSAPPTPKAPPAPKSMVPKHSVDPAYSTIKKDIIYFDLISKVLTKGKDGGVDWDMAAGTDGTSDRSVYLALAMLKDSQGSYQSISTGEEPSRTLLSVLEVAVTVATAVQGEVNKSKNTAYKYPVAGSDVVKGWQKSFTDAYTSANKLAAVARTLPGAPPGGAPLMADSEDPSITVAKTNAKSAQAQAVLESAKNRLTTTQQHLMGTQELYLQSSKQLVEQQNKLGEIHAEITKLGQDQLGLEETKRILIRCIELMVQLKQQIMNLCRFFSAVSHAIEAVTEYTVTPFLSQIEASVDYNGRRVGNYTLTNLTCSFIYQAAITIRAYFSVFGDIASMWVSLSTENIMPGLQLVEEMMLNRGDPKAAQAKATKLHDWSLRAQRAVKELSAKQRREIQTSMQQRVNDIMEVTRELPPVPAVQKAIEEGTGEVHKAAVEGIQSKTATAPINRFALKRV
ncbi:hypothetical protein F4777DRAFT_593418 [Nemania sp. FL0916]|nr:hypothetical protein F4777DRAFT_593418 [Nemania sp. FL0916]